MLPKLTYIEFILIYFLLLTPWPNFQVVRIYCSRDNSRLVRKIVRSKWTPILDKYQVKLPLECPLHPFRDLFAPRQDAKQRDRPTQWTCRKCGKSFYQEKFLDLHFEKRHKAIINMDEDAICLADFCDIMRCEVFQSEEASSLSTGDSHIVTDIEVWGDSLGQSSALARTNAAYLSLIPIRSSAIVATRAAKMPTSRQLCQEPVSQSTFKQNNKAANTEDTQRPRSSFSEQPTIKEKIASSSSTISSTTMSANEPSSAVTESSSSKTSAKPPQQQGKATSEAAGGLKKPQNKTQEQQNNSANSSGAGNHTQDGSTQNMHKIRANCRVEELSKLKTRCEQLLRSCIAPLLLNMADHAFKEMEEEMNKAVCWYLSCDRYWEDGPLEPRAFPWGLIVILVFVLSTGICFCYYIIWILFDTEEATINANHQSYLPAHQQPHHASPYAHHGSAQHYFYQQPTAHELYPEPQGRFEYTRHSPRRYAERSAQQGTPITGHTPYAAQELYDRREYISRPIATSAVTSAAASGSANTAANATAGGGGGSNSSSAAYLDACDSTSSSAAALATSGVRHYNPNLHHHHSLDAHHRHSTAGASQTSLRGSSSSHEIIQSEVGQNEHYIYVTYPPDLKKRYFDKFE